MGRQRTHHNMRSLQSDDYVGLSGLAWLSCDARIGTDATRRPADHHDADHGLRRHIPFNLGHPGTGPSGVDACATMPVVGEKAQRLA
jgi:hypothetical protein